MIINKEWRILTIGDGDLSFSYSLFKHHQPASLTATVYDSLATLTNKYGDRFYQQLNTQNNAIFFEFDIRNPQSWAANVKHQFDLVIFQFPLLPAFSSFSDYKNRCTNLTVNTLNRRLLRDFLINSFTHFLDPKGQQLCFITSKDVAPYRHWNIENALTLQTNIHYLGSIPFDIKMFPGYQIRNVDRDKHVKDTQGLTYVWSKQKDHPIANKLHTVEYHTDNYCTVCRAGPFTTQLDKISHFQSKKHLKLMEFEKSWLQEIEKDKEIRI